MKKIIIVDDVEWIRIILRGLIEKDKRYKVVAEAGNGIEAVHHYRVHAPDIVLMDMNMPVLNGLEALKTIKEMDPDARVIIVSAVDDQREILSALSMGAFSYLLKPINEERLFLSLDEACRG